MSSDIGARIKEGDVVGRDEGIRTKEQVTASAKESSDTSLPFQQLYLTFHNVWYSVDFPSGAEIPENARKGVDGKPRLYLLNVRLSRWLSAVFLVFVWWSLRMSSALTVSARLPASCALVAVLLLWVYFCPAHA